MPRPGLMHRVRAAIAGAISPKAPPRRRQAFAGARFDRLTSDWVLAASRSADAELRGDLRTLRNRARELDRNSPFGARYSQLVAENVVGPKGIRLKAKNKLKDGTDFHRGANASIEAAWVEWSRAENCDLTQKLTLTENLALSTSQWATDGEILIRLWEGPDFGPFGFKVQVLDPDLLDDELNQERSATTPLIRQGVEYNRWGAPAFFHLWTAHPNDALMWRERVKVPADQIIHTFIPRRAGQTRGIPHAAAIMLTLKMLDGYVEAELVAARIASASMGAIEDLPNGDGPAPNPNVGVGDDVSGSTSGSDIPAEAEPGALLDLRGKGHLNLWDPQHPTSAFPDFMRMMSHYAAMGYGISYGTLTGDLSQANYGSLRVGMLDERDHWSRMQSYIIDHVLDRIYRRWLKMALLNGMIPGITDFDVARWTRVLWMPKGFDWIDPLKDVQGELLEVGAGVNSLTRMCAKRGIDFEEMLEERAEEIALLAAYGVPSTLATTITEHPTAPTSTDTGTPDASQADAAGKGFGRVLRVVHDEAHHELRDGSVAHRRFLALTKAREQLHAALAATGTDG
jgi:lambda family phage portal protein